MPPDKDKKLNDFMDAAKKLFVEHFKEETDINVLTSGCSVMVGIAIGYLACYMGDDAAKAKVIEVIEGLEIEDDSENIESFEQSKDIRNLN